MSEMSVMEALVIDATGWNSEEERRLYVRAREVLFAAQRAIYARHREYPDPKAMPPWLPSEGTSTGTEK